MESEDNHATPETSQLSRGDDSLPYHCGAKAANDLDAVTVRRPVSCTPVSLGPIRAHGGDVLGQWRDFRACAIILEGLNSHFGAAQASLLLFCLRLKASTLWEHDGGLLKWRYGLTCHTRPHF